MVARPLASMRRAVTAPTPWILRTDSGARNALASARPITEKPRGFSSSEASLARNLLQERPIDTVMPTSLSMRLAISASASAAGGASVR